MLVRERYLRPSRETFLVLALIAALLLAGAGLGAPQWGQPAHLPFLPVPWWALALVFAAVEAVSLDLQIKREATAVSISELPLVLGLFLAAPADLLVGRVVGSALVFVLIRRSPVLKTTFNLALVGFETCVAVAAFAVVTTWADGLDPLSWGAAYVAVLLAQALSFVGLGLVIAVHEGDARIGSILWVTIAGLRTAPMGITLALIAVTCLFADPRSALLLAGAGGVMLIAYRAYSALHDRHLGLERIFRFSQAVTSSPGVDEVLTSVLTEAKDLLHAEQAEAAFVTPGGSIARVRLDVGGRLRRSEEVEQSADRWLLGAVVDGGAPVLMPRGTRDAAQHRWLEREGVREAVAVPLRGGAGIVGALVVADRLGDVRTFSPEDVLLLETVANHASTALQNGELVDRLRHDAFHDALTGLPNRAELQRLAVAALDDVRDRRSGCAAVLLLDLDGFKDVNDTLGHHQGDQLLVEVAARLTDAVGSAGTVARLGGDEFAVLLPGADAERAQGVGRRILAALEQPVELNGMEVEVGGSLGVALAPQHAVDPATLLKRADVAMYEAKASGRGLCLYEPEIDTATPRRLTMVGELRAALQRGEIDVHVQPKALLTTGEVVGVEALVRWDHPVLGKVSPEEFVPVAERSGLIGPLTSRVLDVALAASAQWRSRGVDVSVAVNLSPRSLRGSDLVEEVARLLRRYGVPGDRLVLEVTEGSVMSDPARSVAILHELRALGVRLSVDDFGTGYSSLSYLKRLPVQEVKIDRSFVVGLREGGGDVPIVRSIVDLGRHLGLRVVAEGVEEQEAWDLLTAMGCDLVQGWHLARAMPVSDFLTWYEQRSRAVPRSLRAV
ncbi:diguanylate cyclase (GGDEF)-like protein [Kineococcus xinjiangensis]|uniref:Diguanylate cyclase (GGDEF)-like protein n=1 Tax=Kineococcus xinjiangensis TaxID=512762 RepID=A0A2S6IDZ7_9ACTN|nr:EAL domain-containing protein [Kineococcus xinjiangensis]PPK92442.1 diguanylate cyclase (GGDEF)-like protein [Kineococcus xinjiangensis]